VNEVETVLLLLEVLRALELGRLVGERVEHILVALLLLVVVRIGLSKKVSGRVAAYLWSSALILLTIALT
jgi:hypothetical protein